MGLTPTLQPLTGLQHYISLRHMILWKFACNGFAKVGLEGEAYDPAQIKLRAISDAESPLERILSYWRSVKQERKNYEGQKAW